MKDRRRGLLIVVACALAAPSAAIGQQKTYRIGFLTTVSRPVPLESDPRLGAFVKEMRERGYIEGKNLQIVWQFADSKYERLPEMAAELVRLPVDLIVAQGGTPAIRAAQRATSTIPIVMMTVGDPVGSGFAASLGRPGGNITGSSLNTGEYAPKFLELLAEALQHKPSRVAVLWNGGSGQTVTPDSLEAVGPKLGVQVLRIDARSRDDIVRGFDTMVRERADAVIITPDPSYLEHASLIAGLALKHRLPSISATQTYSKAGCLLSYGPNFVQYSRLAAVYADKIFKGAKPADLPIEQPANFALLINLRTAKALGLTLPKTLLVRAYELIE